MHRVQGKARSFCAAALQGTGLFSRSILDLGSFLRQDVSLKSADHKPLQNTAHRVLFAGPLGSSETDLCLASLKVERSEPTSLQ